MKRYGYVVVGAGLSGSTVARRLAEESGQRVLVVDRRLHVAGNLRDHEGEHGIRVQDYGPHSFHTSDMRAYRFITRFCEPKKFILRCASVIRDMSTPSPFNFTTIDQFYPEGEASDLKRRLIEYFRAPKATVTELMDATDPVIRSYAEFLFEADYRPYTAKQWGIQPEEIDPSVLARVPVVFSYHNAYFDDEYQFVPRGGFSDFGERMLDHPGIDVLLGTEASDHLLLDEVNESLFWDSERATVVYTGALDELFGYRFGSLPYRSLRFDLQYFETASYQDAPVVAYPQEDGYTRATEYTKLPLQDGGGWTAVAFEYPLAVGDETDGFLEPYYPVLTEESRALYQRYLSVAERFSGLIPCGRLADYRYYNMDQAVLRALDVSDMILNRDGVNIRSDW